jgi:hypothetical protein
MLQAHVARALRAAPPLAFAASLFVSTPGASAPTAVAAVSTDPAARLEIVLREIKIHDDREGIFSGDGEMDLAIAVWQCQDGSPAPCISQQDPAHGKPGLLLARTTKFSAGSGDTVRLNQILPRDGDEMPSDTTRPDIGFPVFPDRASVLRISMWERDEDPVDVNDDEYMGEVYQYLYPDNLGIGTHTVRSSSYSGTGNGDYTVTYEIVHAPLPDLRPVNIKVTDLPGNPKKRVCMAVQNPELHPTGRFEVALAIDGKVPTGATARADDLASGTSTELCVEVELPASGQHQLTANADLFNTVLEYNETNNIYADGYSGTGPASTPQPTTTQPDLTVSTIKVNGRVAGGKDDGKNECKAGKNSVTVVLKNTGTADADDFAVRLAVDTSDDEGKEKAVSGLKAGQEREVNFGDVRLKKGPHSLTATVDSNEEVAESSESNNSRTVPARCSDDD